MALQLNAIFEFDQQSQQLKADFMLVTNWTDHRCLRDGEKVFVGCSRLHCWEMLAEWKQVNERMFQPEDRPTCKQYNTHTHTL